ncbi:MAG: hypothetical protein ACK50J_25645 [Planctomyces sp.]
MRYFMGPTVQIEVGDAKPVHKPEFEEDESDVPDDRIQTSGTEPSPDHRNAYGVVDRVDRIGG